MTLLMDAVGEEVQPTSGGAPTARRPIPASAGDLAVAAAALWWALPLTHATGGRSTSQQAVLLGLLLLATLVTRPWRKLPALCVALPVWLGLAALAVPFLAPTGWRGADTAIEYPAAALTFVVAAAWADTAKRRTIAAAFVGLAGIDQMSHALIPWWGGGDPSVELIGTFYWRNPFAAFLLPVAMLAAAVAVWRLRPWNQIGWVAAPLAVAGVVLSTSRATLAVLVVAWLGLGLLALLRRDGRAVHVRRFAGLTVLAVLLTELLPGPPLFSRHVSALGATTARSSAGETLSANGGFRVEFWRSALSVFAHHPFSGSGYHGLVEASLASTPGSYVHSPLAHSGYLQALSDGGLLLGLPVLIGSALLVWAALRRLSGAVPAASATEPVVVVAALSLLGLLAHSAVDFDWSYPALFDLVALLAALVVAGGLDVASVVPVKGGGAALGLTALAALGCCLIASAPAATGQLRGESVAHAAARLTSDAQKPFASAEPGQELLYLALDNPGGVAAAQKRAAVSDTSGEASVDLVLAAYRARVELTLPGAHPDVAALTAKLVALSPGRGVYAIAVAPLLGAQGRYAEARAELRAPLATSIAKKTAGDEAVIGRAWFLASPAGDPTAACLESLATSSTGQVTAGCHALIAAAAAP